MMRSIFAVILFVMAMSTQVSAETKALQSRGDEPIRIKSDELFTDNNRKMATFSGNVVARQGDVTIYSDKLVVSYSQESGEISTAEVIGNVRIVQGSRRAQSAHGIYDAKLAKITLDGNPKVFQGSDVISGKLIIYYLDEDRSEVTSGPGERVDAVIHPRGKASDGRPAKP
ncbi:MAG TPA: lipopolysaccharide transport periplasmic protein LptA [Geobacteraceae bacterium]|nr:lipopolysaccharide transport periplasmic protein LptA [Geobacteraceae bacterium]